MLLKYILIIRNDLFRFHFLGNSVEQLNAGIDNVEQGSDGCEVEATEPYVDHGLALVPVEIVHYYQHLHCNHAQTVYQTHDDFRLTLVGLGSHQVELECQMHSIQTDQQVNLNQARQSISKAQSEEYLAVEIKDIVNVRHRLIHSIVLHQILKYLHFLLVLAVVVDVYHDQKRRNHCCHYRNPSEPIHPKQA